MTCTDLLVGTDEPNAVGDSAPSYAERGISSPYAARRLIAEGSHDSSRQSAQQGKVQHRAWVQALAQVP